MSISKQNQKNGEINTALSQKIQKLILINEIIDKNISQDNSYIITKKDLYIYEIFIRSFPNILHNMTLITQLSNKFFFLKITKFLNILQNL